MRVDDAAGVAMIAVDVFEDQTGGFSSDDFAGRAHRRQRRIAAKPTNASCAGTTTPCRWHSNSAPGARWSLEQAMASGDLIIGLDGHVQYSLRLKPGARLPVSFHAVASRPSARRSPAWCRA